MHKWETNDIHMPYPTVKVVHICNLYVCEKIITANDENQSKIEQVAVHKSDKL